MVSLQRVLEPEPVPVELTVQEKPCESQARLVFASRATHPLAAHANGIGSEVPAHIRMSFPAGPPSIGDSFFSPTPSEPATATSPPGPSGIPGPVRSSQGVCRGPLSGQKKRRPDGLLLKQVPDSGEKCLNGLLRTLAPPAARCPPARLRYPSPRPARPRPRRSSVRVPREETVSCRSESRRCPGFSEGAPLV